MRKRYLFLFGVLAYVVSLGLKVPVTQLLHWSGFKAVTLSGAQGSVWSGSAVQVQANGQTFSGVRWNMLPAQLIRGEIAYAVQAEYAGGDLTAEVAADWRRDLHAREVTYEIDAQRLSDFMPLPIAQFDGRIKADVTQVTMQQGALTHVAGTVVWPRATLTSPFEAVLGNYDVRLGTNERGHRAELRGKDGMLDAEGDVRLQANGRFVAEIRLRPARNAPRDLVDSLRLFSRRQRDGSYLIKQAGRLQDFL